MFKEWAVNFLKYDGIYTCNVYLHVIPTCVHVMHTCKHEMLTCNVAKKFTGWLVSTVVSQSTIWLACKAAKTMLLHSWLVETSIAAGIVFLRFLDSPGSDQNDQVLSWIGSCWKLVGNCRLNLHFSLHLAVIV